PRHYVFMPPSYFTPVAFLRVVRRTGSWLSSRIALAVALAAAWPSASYAQEERFGAIQGTWDACIKGTKPLADRYAATQGRVDASEAFKSYLEHRLAVELDKCAKLGDAPLSALLEVIGRYRRLN